MKRQRQCMKTVFAAGALALVACEAEFDPSSRVTDVRVLAVQADQPYARPGENVHLAALSHDPKSRSITWAWAACVRPPSSAIEACLATMSERAEREGQSPLIAMGEEIGEVDYTIPADSLEGLDQQTLPLALVGIVSVACPGTLDWSAAGGENPFSCTDSDSGRELEFDEYVMGIKRITIRHDDRNANPEIEQMTFNGEIWPEGEIREVDACNARGNEFDDCPDSKAQRIGTVVAKSSFESGRDEFGRSFSEDLVVHYYATEGIFEHEVRVGDQPDTRWVARAQAAGQQVDLWVVVRDDRGGVSWAQRQVRVR